MAGPLALLGTLNTIKFGLDLLGGKKQKQQPDKSKALNFMGETPASDAVVDVDAEVVGTETVSASANVVPQTTMVPNINISPVGDGGVGSIVNQINEINSNIAAISQAMQSSADIETKYRKDLEESIQQDIADRDKLQAKKRAENRRDSFGKKLLSGPKKVAGVAGSTLAKGLGLEALAALFPTKEERKDRIKKTLVGDDAKPKPEGFMRGLAGIADFVTGDLTDFDNRGVIGSEINAAILENKDKKDDNTDKTIKDKNKASKFIGGKNETTNETINEINNNTTIKNSTNKTTKEQVASSTNLSNALKGEVITPNVPKRDDYPRTVAGFREFTDAYKNHISGNSQVNPNSIEKSAGSLISGITGAVDKTVPVEDQKGSIRVFDHRSKGSGKGDGGTTIGKGVSDEVPSVSPERGVSLNEIFQRSSVA